MGHQFFAKRAIIGKDLSLEKNVCISVGSGGRIKKISSGKPNTSSFKEFREDLIVPGFVNSHTHIGDSFAKEKAYGMNIEATVAPPDGLKHKLLRQKSKKIKVQGMRWAIKAMFSGGTTCFIDFRERGKEGVKLLRKVAEEEHIKTKILGRPYHNEKVENVLTVSDGIGMSSSNIPTKNLNSIRKTVNRFSGMLGFHASETKDLRRKSINTYGKSDIVRGVTYLSPSFIVHATHASPRDINFLKNRNIPIVICPRCNAYLGVGVPPIKSFIDSSVPLSIGTDNVMLNSPNLFREFDFISRITRLQGKTLHPRQLLRMVTVHPSKFLGEKHYLTEDALADFFVFDLNRPNVKRVTDPITALVLRGTKLNVKSTYIHGKKVWEN